MEFTKEQEDIVNKVVKEYTENTGEIILVNAGAGCGKTTLSVELVDILKPKSGLYTAFNKAIILESEAKFNGSNIICKTFHALAHKYVKPTKPIQSLSYKCIKENITYTEKRKLIEAIDRFFVSASDCMYKYFNKEFKNERKAEYLTELATKYIDEMAEGRVNPTFNFLLKYLHLMLVDKSVVIKLDLLILDEINDVTAVVLEIFKLVTARCKIGLGEKCQAIYSFLNLVNGFDELKDESTLMPLTSSFRCSKDIANRIENKMVEVLDKDFTFKGTDKPLSNGKTLYCTLTNAVIISKLKDRLDENKGFTLLRSPSDIFAAPLAVVSASQGKKPYQHKYAFLLDAYGDYKKQSRHKSYYSFLSAEINDDEINNAIMLLKRLNSENISIYELYNDIKNAKKDKNYTVATVYTSKGMEYETVYIGNDLNDKFLKACKRELDLNEEEVIKRCYYVACSRCGINLINSVL